MAGFLQTLQKRVAGRVLVYSNLGTALVRGSSISRRCRCGHGLDYTGCEVGRWLDQWESEFDHSCWCPREVDDGFGVKHELWCFQMRVLACG